MLFTFEIFIVIAETSFGEYLSYINFIFSQNAILCLLRHMEYLGLISSFVKSEDSSVSERLWAPTLWLRGLGLIPLDCYNPLCQCQDPWGLWPGEAWEGDNAVILELDNNGRWHSRSSSCWDRHWWPISAFFTLI